MNEPEPIPRETERIGAIIVDSALKVHKALGPGLLESAYEACLCHELRRRGLRVATQVSVPICYDGETVEAGFRLDILVEGQVIVEVKAVEKMNPVFEAQLMTYLRLSQLRLGFLINFNVPLVKDGIQRIAM